MVFGKDVLEHAKSLCQGHVNYLEKLPNALLLHIMGFLELEDVGQLLRTSHRFWKLCQSEEFWENAVRQRCSTLSDEVVSLACDIGWRRIFFTNKIQLQLLINRRSTKLQEALEDMSDQNDTSECSPVNKSPNSLDEKSESGISSSGEAKQSSESPILSLSSDDSLPGPKSPPSNPISSGEAKQSSDSPILSLSSDDSLPGPKSPPSNPISSGDEKRPSDSPILSLGTDNRLPSPISSSSDISSEDDPDHRKFIENLKKFQLTQSGNSDSESEDSLSESENLGVA